MLAHRLGIYCKYIYSLKGHISVSDELKEAYRLFYLVKGHLEASPQTVLDSAKGYFRRLWIDGGDGAPLYDYDEEFEQAWERKYGKQENRRSQ